MEYATLKDKMRAEKAEREARYAKFAEVVTAAETAARNAAETATPTPMVVKNIRGEVVDVVADGVCGFGWVRVRPGGSSFARWLVKTGRGRTDSYAGGVTIYPRGLTTQSLTRNDAWANAYAKALRETLGVDAYGMSRID